MHEAVGKFVVHASLLITCFFVHRVHATARVVNAEHKSKPVKGEIVLRVKELVLINKHAPNIKFSPSVLINCCSI